VGFRAGGAQHDRSQSIAQGVARHMAVEMYRRLGDDVEAEVGEGKGCGHVFSLADKSLHYQYNIA
jgi:hypothetical protein